MEPRVFKYYCRRAERNFKKFKKVYSEYLLSGKLTEISKDNDLDKKGLKEQKKMEEIKEILEEN